MGISAILVITVCYIATAFAKDSSQKNKRLLDMQNLTQLGWHASIKHIKYLHISPRSYIY